MLLLTIERPNPTKMESGPYQTSKETMEVSKAYIFALEDLKSVSGKNRCFCRETHAVIKHFHCWREGKNLFTIYPHRTWDAIIQRYRNKRCEGAKFEGTVASIKAKKPIGGPTEEEVDWVSLSVTMVTQECATCVLTFEIRLFHRHTSHMRNPLGAYSRWKVFPTAFQIAKPVA